MANGMHPRSRPTGLGRRQTRPSIKSPCVADQYHAPDERIAEFHFPRTGKGGLISLREIYNPKRGTYDSAVVEVYRQDEGVHVQTGNAKDWNDPAKTPAAPVSRPDLLRRALPLLVKLGDFIGNGPIDPNRPASLGERCDLVGDIHDALEQPRKLWAAYTSTPKHGVNGISLHRTYRDALLSVLSYAEAGGNDYTPNDDPLSDEDLYEHVSNAMEQEGDDWYVAEVEIP